MTKHGSIEYTNHQKEWKKEYVVLPYKEFIRVQEEFDDYQNLRCLREAKEAEQYAPTVRIEEIKKHLKIPNR